MPSPNIKFESQQSHVAQFTKNLLYINQSVGGCSCLTLQMYQLKIGNGLLSPFLCTAIMYCQIPIENNTKIYNIFCWKENLLGQCKTIYITYNLPIFINIWQFMILAMNVVGHNGVHWYFVRAFYNNLRDIIFRQEGWSTDFMGFKRFTTRLLVVTCAGVLCKKTVHLRHDSRVAPM